MNVYFVCFVLFCLEAIKSAIRFKKELVDAFFKQIQSVESVVWTQIAKGVNNDLFD